MHPDYIFQLLHAWLTWGTKIAILTLIGGLVAVMLPGTNAHHNKARNQ